MTHYIVINENEIVKAEMERPVPLPSEFAAPSPAMQSVINSYKDHCLSLPRIAIKGKHNWKVWQEVIKGKDFYLNPLFEVGDVVKCLFNDSGHKFWFTREQKLTVSRVKKNKSVPFELSFKEKGEGLFYANDFEHTNPKPIVAIPIQPTPEGEKDAEKTVSQMAEIIQKECHSLVSAVMKESKKRITVQDATNAYMFHKLAELQSRINQLEQSSSITLLTNDNHQTK